MMLPCSWDGALPHHVSICRFSLQVLSIIHKYIKYACELCIKGWCQEYVITIFLYIILFSEMVVW